MFIRRTLVTTSLVLSAAGVAFAQTKKPVPSCTVKAFAAFKQLPKLEYDCPESGNDSDDKILKVPERKASLAAQIRTLESFTDAGWWAANVDELNACELHGQAGELTDEEKEKWRSGDYHFSLVGDHEMRLALLPDPCYQTGYNGSNVLLLYRKNGKVFVTQLIDGYYSRVENSVGFEVALLSGRQVIEVQTANSFPPSLLSYFFEIDPSTNKATPHKLFKEGKKFTNQIYSDMLMAEPTDVGLPKDATELNIIRNHRLAPTFSAYVQDEHGKIDGRLRRVVYRWNGRFYAAARGN